MSMFEVVCKKLYFLRQTMKNAILTLLRFAYMANRDSELGTETTLKIVSMPRI